MVSESRTGEKKIRLVLTQAWEPDEGIKIDVPNVNADLQTKSGSRDRD
jgi:hypothetical protein